MLHWYRYVRMDYYKMRKLIHLTWTLELYFPVVVGFFCLSVCLFVCLLLLLLFFNLLSCLLLSYTWFQLPALARSLFRVMLFRILISVDPRTLLVVYFLDFYVHSCSCSASIFTYCLQPWCNPLWLTGLKAPTNQLTYCLLLFFCWQRGLPEILFLSSLIKLPIPKSLLLTFYVVLLELSPDIIPSGWLSSKHRLTN